MLDRINLFAAMRAGATIITPNNRLSNQLLQDFFWQNQTHAIDKPHCLPWQAFLQELFQNISLATPNIHHPTVLTPQQLHFLWRQILKEHSEYTCSEGLLTELIDAWTRCQHWQLQDQHPAFMSLPQTQQYQQWQSLLRTQLANNRAITLPQLGNYLIEQLNTHAEKFMEFTRQQTKQLIWICFDEFTPQQKSLQQTFTQLGWESIFYDLPPSESKVVLYPAKDYEDETQQLIQWLIERLANGEKKIGVVIPDLQNQAHKLTRLLHKHLPENTFSISLGQPLTQFPIIAHALTWLNIDKYTITHHQARLLLHSPYVSGGQSESIPRAHVMEYCKLFQENTLSLAQFMREICSSCPKLYAVLHQLNHDPQQDSLINWIGHFKQRLEIFAFPGENSLNSINYQCAHKFLKLFNDFAACSIVSEQMTRQQALDNFNDLVHSTIFQIQSSTKPIQISGLLEASGCIFDSVWISGLTDHCLPQKIRLSAFIPISLQRELQMPHAVTARELQFAQQILNRLQYGSQYCVFSYPQLIGDLTSLPSPLIRNFPKLQPLDIPESTQEVAIIPREETYLLPFNSTQAVAGGTTLLANQAKCPFRAFAAHRLHAQASLQVNTGLNAAERGQIVHRIMEIIWQKLQTQANLLTINQENLNNIINQAIHSALQPLLQTRADSLPKLIQSLETSRLKKLVLNCLEWEKTRPAFKIAALEQTWNIDLAGLQLRVRLDRLDQINADTQWVIDYKSSLPTTNPWYAERPESPQLLLYALLDAQINTLLFIALKANQINCSGFSNEEYSISGIRTLKAHENWTEIKDRWRTELYQLADEFQSGHCTPSPKNKQICQRCEFKNLCRIETINR